MQTDTAQYFTISGQSGHFAHNSPFVTPMLRVGEPALVRVLNAGLWTHSLHIHGNHVYVLKVNGVFNAVPEISTATIPALSDNHIWIDTFTAQPLDVWDWLIPYLQPGEVPNDLGIGRADLERFLPVIPDPVPFGVVIQPDGTMVDGLTPAGVTTWPPVQELNMAIPKVGTKAGNVPIHVPLAPLCYPMHDHSEPTQTAQGGNYTQGMIAGLNVSGDRNTDGRLQPAGVITFPHAPVQFGPDFNISPQPPAGPTPPFPEIEEGNV